jgi:short-subunit dehydrogenase
MKNICVITGASRGLGKELASLFASKTNVCLISRDQKELEKVGANLKKLTKNQILTFAGDISDENFVKSVFNELQQNKFQISALINNAGVGRFCKVTENTRKIIDEVLSASFIGTILVTSNALPLMKNDGTIATIMSTAGIQGNANETAYCGAKWGARGFMEALRKELLGTKMKIISVFPGGIDTTFWTENRHYVSKEKSDTFMNPKELAHVIFENLADKKTLCVKELIIERLK